MGFIALDFGVVSLRLVSILEALALSSFSTSFSTLLLRLRGVGVSSVSILRGVTGLAIYGGKEGYVLYTVSGKLVLLPLPGVGVCSPGVIGMAVRVGLRGDSGLRSSATPLRWVGDMSGFTSIFSFTGFRPPRNNFFVLNLRARLEPTGCGTGAGVGRSGVGNGYISMICEIVLLFHGYI